MKDKAWKAYFITCGLLARFDGVHSMIAEKDLFMTVLSWVSGKTQEKELLDLLRFDFSMGKRELRGAEKEFTHYTKEENAIYEVEPMILPKKGKKI